MENDIFRRGHCNSACCSPHVAHRKARVGGSVAPSSEKAEALQTLVHEQVQKGHIVPTTSPWNTPVFVIKKKSGRWRLLHDLQQVNAVIEDMGALQPGMPSPTVIPQNWDIIVLGLKDSFFTIFLAPEDAPKFAFSLPSVNHQAPMQ